jgi:Flp pilus assembly secretin CpaC
MSSLLPKHRRTMLASAVVVLITILPGLALAGNLKIAVTVGQSITHKITEDVKTVSIADSRVADVVVAGPREVLINGKEIGLTTIVIWDENNVSSIYDVVVRGPFSDSQIELRVQVAEVNKTRALELGADFYGKYTNSYTLDGAVFPGNVATPSLPLAIFQGATEGPTAALRWIKGNDQLQMMLRALITNGVLHVLAEPNVVASSGQGASFLSGGEIPVPIATGGVQGGTAITIEWKEFGVKVDFVPTIVDSGIINLEVSPEVSSLDYSNGVEISGFRIPAIRLRKASTVVELKDRETLVIGGLIMEEEIKFRERMPILGHIPLLGYLFSHTDTRKSETELVLVVSPHIIQAMPPGTQATLPTLTDDDHKKITGW